jgi:hypothetical protein
MSAYFIGLTFSSACPHYQEINRYRALFDDKFSRNNKLQMTLIPPFQINLSNKNKVYDFEEHLQEVIDNHLLGHPIDRKMTFHSIGMALDRAGMIYLRLDAGDDLLHIQESLMEVVGEYGGSFHFLQKRRSTNINERIVLPIGRTSQKNFDLALEEAKCRFDLPLSLKPDSISLFEKKPGLWPLKMTLFRYPINEQSFLMETTFA